MIVSHRKYIRHQAEAGNLFLAAKVDSGHVGNVGVKIDYDNRVANVSILIFKSFASKGFGKRVFVAGVELCKSSEVIRKIEAGTLASNKAMIRLMAAAGLNDDGVRKQHHMIGGNAVDSLYFATFNE